MDELGKRAHGYQFKHSRLNDWMISRILYPTFDVFWKKLYEVVGGENRPVFFDVEKTEPTFSILKSNYEIIQKELNGLLPDKDKFPRYYEVDIEEYDISGGGNPDVNWKVFMLESMGNKPEENRRRCPRTCEMLDSIPNKTQAFLSILDPKKNIPPHDTFGMSYIRYHLGIKVPKENPPSIRVKDQHYTWQEGEHMLFDHSWEHQVYNEADEIRVVLIVDIYRPMPKTMGFMNRVIQLFAKYSYGRRIMYNLEKFNETMRKPEPEPEAQSNSKQ